MSIRKGLSTKSNRDWWKKVTVAARSATRLYCTKEDVMPTRVLGPSQNNGYIYLAGPISIVSLEEATGWRDNVEQELSCYWDVLNPMWNVKYIPKPGRQTSRVALMYSASGVATRDEYYIRKCDFILANLLGVTEASIGTIWELGFGYALGKLIVTVMEEDSIHDHSFIRRRSHVFVPTLEEAIKYFKDIAV